MSKNVHWSQVVRIDADADRGAAIFLRIGTVVRMTGLGRSTIYRLMAEDQFPHPVKLTPRVAAWRRTDLERWGETQASSSR
jgi:prophage regulatory protein